MPFARINYIGNCFVQLLNGGYAGYSVRTRKTYIYIMTIVLLIANRRSTVHQVRESGIYRRYRDHDATQVARLLVVVSRWSESELDGEIDLAVAADTTVGKCGVGRESRYRYGRKTRNLDG